MDAKQLEALSVESATIVTRPGTWARVRRNGSVRLGGIALLILVLVALAAPWLGTVDPSLFDPASRDLTPGKTGEITTLEGETLQHRFLMGSDSFGRDIHSRVIYGTRVSLYVGLLTVGFAVITGTLLGAIAGFFGGWADNVIMRILDVVLAFPFLLLAIAIVSVLGPGLTNAMLAIAIISIPAYARVTRASVLSVREMDFIEASRALGASNWHILFNRILPNALPPLIVVATPTISETWVP